MAKDNFITCPHCGKSLFVPFESTAEVLDLSPKPKKESAWAEAATNLTTIGITFTGVGLMAWWYELPMWLPASASVIVGLGLPVLKIMLNAPAPLPNPKPQIKRINVTMETPLPSGNKIQLDETFGVQAHVLQHAAKKAVNNNFEWSRRKIMGGPCSQTSFEKISAAMVKNYWAQYKRDDPNGGIIINRHGQAVLRAIAAQKI